MSSVCVVRVVALVWSETAMNVCVVRVVALVWSEMVMNVSLCSACSSACHVDAAP